MKLGRIAASVAACLFAGGCATIIQGTTQSVSLTTYPLEGAKCELRNSEGVWYLTTPGSTVVHKTKNDLAVLCRKDGYQDAMATVAAKFGATTAGNIIAGGLVGIAVDAASGANYSYAGSTIITLDPKVAVSIAPPAEQPREIVTGAGM